MADEPKTPQQLIDDAAKALGDTSPETPAPVAEASKEETKEQLPPHPEPKKIAEVVPTPEAPKLEVPTLEEPLMEQPVIVPPKAPEPLPVVIPTTTEVIAPPPPPPQPEAMIIPQEKPEEPKPTEEAVQNPPKPKEKKKSNKGALIATLLFFILTLPIAVYYVVQSPQFAEIRSRATEYPCHYNGNAETQAANGCSGQCGPSVTNRESCLGKRGTIKTDAQCCNWVNVPTSTPTSVSKAPKDGTIVYTTGSCAGKEKTSTYWPLDCGKQCCNRNDQVCCCMGCFSKGTDCNSAPYNCKTPTTVGCPKTTCYSGYPGTDVPHENCLVCSPDRSKLSTVTFSSDGTVRIHMDNVASGTTVSLTKDGTAATVTKISEGNFNAVVSAGTYTISVKLGNETAKSVGFIQPDSNNKCGRYDPSSKRDISSAISSLSSYDITTVSGVNYPYQCWADAIQGTDSDLRGQLDANYDFNDFDVIIGYTAGVTNTPAPTATPTNTPVPTATPTTKETYVYPTNTPAPTKVRLVAEATEMPSPTPTNQPTPKIPVAGVGPGLIGTLSVAGSVILLLVGLAL